MTALFTTRGIVLSTSKTIGGTMTASNVVIVTEQGAAPVVTLTASTLTEPASGGTVVLTGVTNEPDGTSYTLWVSINSGAFVNSGLPATTSSGGMFSFTYDIPANMTTVPVTYSFQTQG